VTRRWAARLGAAVVALLTLVAGQTIIDAEPDVNEIVAPFYVAGSPDQRVQVGSVAVTMLGVRGAATLVRPDGGVIDTTGVWIIVRVRLEATTSTTTVNYAAVADGRGRSFRLSGRFRQGFSEGMRDLHPGIPVAGEMAFEVPRDAATSLTLRVAESYDAVRGLEMRPVTDIKVPVTADALAGWLGESTPATVQDAKVVR
jgi:hypothetical protein